MAVSAAWAAVAVAGTGAYVANENAKDAAADGRENAKKNATASAEASNKANQKRVNSSALLSSNQMAAKGGQSGTMLTGPTGVDPSALQLGKTTLLGGGGG